MKVNDPKTLQAAQRDCKNILKVSNHLLHYDFTKKFEVYKISGKFTVKHIEKIVDGFTRKNILLFTCDTCGYYKNRYFIAQICSNGTINIDFKLYNSKCDYHTFDKYYKKGTFEEYRKNNDTITYIIVQDANAAIIPGVNYMDYNGRVKLTPGKWDAVRYAGDGRGHSWVSEVNATDRRGKAVKYHPLHRSAPALENIVDKSGYIVDYYKLQLLTRLQAYKADNRKKEYLQAVDPEKINILLDKINALKTRVIKAFTAAGDSEKIYSIVSALHWDYSRVYRGYEIYRDKTREKAYKSITESDRAFNDIIEIIDKITNKLNEVQKND